MGPMGLQCAKLQRDDLEHCWQSLQETHRGHSNHPFQRKEGTQKLKTCKKNMEGRLLRYALSGIFGYLSFTIFVHNCQMKVDLRLRSAFYPPFPTSELLIVKSTPSLLSFLMLQCGPLDLLQHS